MEASIATYGYAGIFVGTFLEGETTVVLGGIFSKLGYLDLRKVIFWAFLGTFAGDFTFFALGRVFGRSIIERFRFLKEKVPRANAVIRKYGNPIVFLVRFLVGIRGLVLLLLGCTDMKIRKFLLLSTANSLIWSVGIALLGYVFGKILYVFIHHIQTYEYYAMPAIVAVVLIAVVIYRHIVKEREKAYGDQ